MKYKIVDICYFENDAILEINGKRHYFQFNKEPTIREALWSLFCDGKIKIEDRPSN